MSGERNHLKGLTGLPITFPEGSNMGPPHHLTYHQQGLRPAKPIPLLLCPVWKLLVRIAAGTQTVIHTWNDKPSQHWTLWIGRSFLGQKPAIVTENDNMAKINILVHRFVHVDAQSPIITVTCALFRRPHLTLTCSPLLRLILALSFQTILCCGCPSITFLEASPVWDGPHRSVATLRFSSLLSFSCVSLKHCSPGPPSHSPTASRHYALLTNLGHYDMHRTCRLSYCVAVRCLLVLIKKLQHNQSVSSDKPLYSCFLLISWWQ